MDQLEPRDPHPLRPRKARAVLPVLHLAILGMVLALAGALLALW
jgi:hypothetical protein